MTVKMNLRAPWALAISARSYANIQAQPQLSPALPMRWRWRTGPDTGE